MNLFELLLKSDPLVRIDTRNAGGDAWTPLDNPRAVIHKMSAAAIAQTPARGVLRRVAGRLMRSFYERVRAAADPSRAAGQVRGALLRSGMRMVVRDAARHWPRVAAGEGRLGFASLGQAAQTDVTIAWRTSDGRVTTSVSVTAAPALAWHTLPPAGEGTDLVVEVPQGSRAKVFVGVHRVLDRRPLLALCRGDGFEIGPGPKPQVLPATDVRVRYVEQAPPEQWKTLYGKDSKVPVDERLWEHYVIGTADQLPAEPGSLDFIFSSHVVEHLGNPLGHLAYWATLLRPGGVVAAVIPDRDGCKDYVFPASSESELLAEIAAGDMQPTVEHYRRWCARRMPNADPAELRARGRSIHVHFYTPHDLGRVLDHVARSLGFAEWSVTAEPNHKDFFVVLRKAPPAQSPPA